MSSAPENVGSGRITLLTDFGTADGYVAAMRGVIAVLAPHAVVDDVSHAIPPGDIAAGAWTLSRYWRIYPPGTVHVVVVDPGVGTSRRGLAARVADRLFVAPDNGVLTPALRASGDAEVYSLENRALWRAEVSATFHGRDVFAPVGAHLCRGWALEECGARIEDPVLLTDPPLQGDGEWYRGTVVHVDHFGNLITNLPGALLSRSQDVHVGDQAVDRRAQTYGELRTGEVAALVGSMGDLEIARRDGSAAQALGARPGTPVRLRLMR